MSEPVDVKAAVKSAFNLLSEVIELVNQHAGLEFESIVNIVERISDDEAKVQLISGEFDDDETYPVFTLKVVEVRSDPVSVPHSLISIGGVADGAVLVSAVPSAVFAILYL